MLTRENHAIFANYPDPVTNRFQSVPQLTTRRGNSPEAVNRPSGLRVSRGATASRPTQNHNPKQTDQERGSARWRLGFAVESRGAPVIIVTTHIPKNPCIPPFHVARALPELCSEVSL